MSSLVAAVLDAVLVIVFSAVGRRSHAEGLTVGGVAQTAWPFLTGALAGWLAASLALSAPPRSLTFGAVVVGATVVVGMLLRVATGAGTALSFVAVATTVLAVLLLGWRLIGRLLG